MQNANLFLISLCSNDYFCNFLQEFCKCQKKVVSLRENRAEENAEGIKEQV